MRQRFIAGKKIFSGLIIALMFAGTSLAATQGGKSTKVKIPLTPEQYATEPQPLTAEQCGQCHPGLFRNLKEEGGKHRFGCQKCHNTFHAYSPRKGNWDAIMPKCSNCHETPHGPKITDCAGCHSNPHTPKKIAATAQLTNACFNCHASARDQLVNFPSKHSKVACTTCHTSHGYKPSCFNCHKPHTPGQGLATCTTCHPVHRPMQISYGKDVPSPTCGACHAKVYNIWLKGTSKHKTVACATCHKDKHRFVPKCSDCHGMPHKKMIHEKFPRCLTCHIDVHDLHVMPSKSK